MRITQEQIRQVAKAIDKSFPKIIPNHIASAGVILHAGGILLTEVARNCVEPSKGVHVLFDW